MQATSPNLVNTTKRRLNALTTLRFFAAMHVVLFHCAPTLAEKTAQRLAALTNHSPALLRDLVAGLSQAMIAVMNAGPWSVSFFFILSGFILVYNYDDDRRKFDVPKFWVARFARIYPVYLIGFLLAMPFVLDAVWQAHGHGAYHAATGGLLAATLLQSWVPYYATFWNIPAWSLSVEAFFYAVFPLLLIRLRRIDGVKTLVAVILGCWLVSVAKDPVIELLAGGSSSTVTAIVRYFPLCRLPEFVAGMALGRIMLMRGGVSMRWAGWLAATSIDGIALLAALGSHRPMFLNALGSLAPLFVLMIWSLTNEETPLAKLLGKKPLVFLGESSYSIYILHLPLFAIWSVATEHVGVHSSTSAHVGMENYLLPMAFIVGMVFLCGLVYRMVEMPARDVIRQAYAAWVRPVATNAVSAGLKVLEPSAT
jgi:peptidoglycan/LPS O-acetylase OafA/YrhL